MHTASKGFPSCSPGIRLDQQEQGTSANELLYEKIKGALLLLNLTLPSTMNLLSLNISLCACRIWAEFS